jgi:addiction module HigA family antidote
MSSIQSNQYEPDLVTPPGEILLEKLEEIGMTQADLAERIGRTKKTVNEIIKGKAPILSETALQLERVLAIPARFWTNAEGQYREFLAREQERQRLSGHLGWLKTIPVKKMIELGWLPQRTDPVVTLQDALSFFGVASPEALSEIGKEKRLAFRQSVAHHVDPYALLAWIRKGEIEAQRQRVLPARLRKLGFLFGQEAADGGSADLKAAGITSRPWRRCEPRTAGGQAVCLVGVHGPNRRGHARGGFRVRTRRTPRAVRPWRVPQAWSDRALR